MFFGTNLDIDDNLSVSIYLRSPERPLLFQSKPRTLSESDVISAITSSKTAMAYIRIAAKRNIVITDEGMYLVPVTIAAAPSDTPEPVKKDAEILIPEPAELSTETARPRNAPATNPPIEQIQYLRALNEMALTTIGAVIKSANESLAKVAQAQAEGLKALTVNFNTMHASVDRLGSLPTKIFEDSNEKVDALIKLAQERAEAKSAQSGKPADTLGELKELMGFVQSLKGAFE